jgi:hypothetical protein
MRLRCDHCRGNLGVVVHRYWRMRFCSPACRCAYERRLNEDTKAKIRRLGGVAREELPAIARLLGSRMLAGVTRHFAG